MPKDIGPKCRKCRREGMKLFLKGERCFSPKCAIVKRNYLPGQFGEKKQSRLSEFGVQLREKQKAKRIYGIRERQFKRYYQRALGSHENTEERMVQLLELRLDNVMYRSGLAPSHMAARQLVNHKHILVNKVVVSVPSYQLKVGDVIEPKPELLQRPAFQELTKTIANKERPSWLTIDAQALQVRVVGLPTWDTAQMKLAMNLIVEYYSRQ